MLFCAEGVGDDGSPIFRKLLFINGKFQYVITNGNGITIERYITPLYPPSRQVWYLITLSPILGENGADTFLIVTSKKATNGLFPSTEKTPSESLYPTFGTWED